MQCLIIAEREKALIDALYSQTAVVRRLGRPRQKISAKKAFSPGKGCVFGSAAKGHYLYVFPLNYLVPCPTSLNWP